LVGGFAAAAAADVFGVDRVVWVELTGRVMVVLGSPSNGEKVSSATKSPSPMVMPCSARTPVSASMVPAYGLAWLRPAVSPAPRLRGGPAQRSWAHQNDQHRWNFYLCIDAKEPKRHDLPKWVRTLSTLTAAFLVRLGWWPMGIIGLQAARNVRLAQGSAIWTSPRQTAPVAYGESRVGEPGTMTDRSFALICTPCVLWQTAGNCQLPV
jgi:hypothetical protein